MGSAIECYTPALAHANTNRAPAVRQLQVYENYWNLVALVVMMDEFLDKDAKM